MDTYNIRLIYEFLDSRGEASNLKIIFYGVNSENENAYKLFYKSKVTFTFSRSQFIENLSSAYTYIRLTKTDSFGLTCFEAAALNLNIIASNRGVRPSNSNIVYLNNGIDSIRAQLNEYCLNCP